MALILFVLLGLTSVAVLNPGLSVLQTALPAMIAASLWLLFGLVFVVTFADVPPSPTPQVGVGARLLRRVNRGFHWLLAGAFGIATAAAVVITARLLNDIWP